MPFANPISRHALAFGSCDDDPNEPWASARRLMCKLIYWTIYCDVAMHFLTHEPLTPARQSVSWLSRAAPGAHAMQGSPVRGCAPLAVAGSLDVTALGRGSTNQCLFLEPYPPRRSAAGSSQSAVQYRAD